MKYHKIPKVAKEVCTAEQKIAYNIAFSHAHISMDADKIFKANYDKVTESERKNFVAEVVRKCMEFYKLGNNSGKYDVDAIFSALNAGMYNYLNAKYHILSSYEEIGKMFPALYL